MVTELWHPKIALSCDTGIVRFSRTGPPPRPTHSWEGTPSLHTSTPSWPSATQSLLKLCQTNIKLLPACLSSPQKRWVLVCWWCQFDWSCCHHLHPCSDKIQNGGILVSAYPGCPWKWPLNECCCCYYYYFQFLFIRPIFRRLLLHIRLCLPWFSPKRIFGNCQWDFLQVICLVLHPTNTVKTLK